MACGVHLGILLVCLVQAEHVRCSWASRAQSDTYVGSSQRDSGLKRLGGSSSQNQFRQASVSKGSAQRSDRETAVLRSPSQRFTSGGLSKTILQPAYKGHASPESVESKMESNPAKQKTNWPRVPSEKGFEKLSFDIYNPIASGSSISKYNKNQNSQTNERKLTWSTSNSASGLSPLSESPSFTSQSAGRRPWSAANKRPADYGQRGSSSSLFSAGAASRQQNSTWLQTSACGLGRRVSSLRHSGASEPSHVLLPQSERTRNNPSQAKAGKPYHNYQLPENRGSSSPTFNMASKHVGYSQDLPLSSHKQNALAGRDPFSLHTLKSLGRGSSTCPSAPQAPSSVSFSQASHNNRNPTQGAQNLPVIRSSREGSSAHRFAPSRAYSVPRSFGGSAIRRLKKPADHKEKHQLYPLQTDPPSPQQPLPYKPQFHRRPQRSKWFRIKPGSLTQQVQ
ncbi:hypothetical protein Q5P01_017998 [Channa striata]|uniref:Uncharacterized protein n=1 Tax=Channa striata TaxID=64152 RepID=A0AA88M6E7_CHASR|nr:hypothetical protein Q5P01_017998 [Channa striata]